MKVEIYASFSRELDAQVRYIARDKPTAAKKFNRDILKRISEIPKSPFSNRPSVYFTHPDYRDLIFKGYKIVYKVDESADTVFIIGLVNMQRGLRSKY